MDKRLQPELREETPDREHDEEIEILERAGEAPQHDESEERDDGERRRQAQLLAGNGEDEIGMRVGQRQLHRSLSRPGAGEPAMDEGVERAVHLVGVAGGWIEESIDAARDVREDEISADQPAYGHHGQR